jgi:type II secretory pathway pseudopilin PulG
MNKKSLVSVALAGLMLASAGASFAQSSAKARQKDKNDMRNLGLGLGALAVHKSLKGDPKTALLLGAGAAYAGKKYEDQRKAQKTWRKYRYNSRGKKIGYYQMRGNRRTRYVSYR